MNHRRNEATTPASDDGARLADLARATEANDTNWAEIAKLVAELRAQESGPDEYRILEAEALFRPIPPAPSLVAQLGICPGAPAMIAGYGFSGKTVAAQALALNVATGGNVWGHFAGERAGRVVHVDFEQGSDLTSQRYQRLARGLRVAPAALNGNLALVPLPQAKLDTPAGVRMIEKVARGAQLVIIDSLRACASIDENSSEIRRVLDVLLRVSEETGACFLVVHHAGKPSDTREGKHSVRGSSAIFDACSSLLLFSGAPHESVRVSHLKSRNSGRLEEDFELLIEDVDDGDGLTVRVSVDGYGEASRNSKVPRLTTQVLDRVRSEPGIVLRKLREGLGNTKQVSSALEHLRAQGVLREEKGPKNARKFYADVAPAKSVA